MNSLYKCPKLDGTYIITPKEVLANFYTQNEFNLWGIPELPGIINSFEYNKNIITQTCKKILIYE